MKPVKLLSVDEASEGGKMDIWDAFRRPLSHHPNIVTATNSCSDATFKGLLEDYLQNIDNCQVRTLEDLIEFNKEHASQELPPSEFTCPG